MRLFSGFESTHILGRGTDVLETTRHLTEFASDFALVRSCQLAGLRYSIPWHRIERTPGVYDWSWTDRSLGCLHSLGVPPIFDPLHHQLPGMAHRRVSKPAVCFRLCAICHEVSRPLSLGQDYTIVNEPFATAMLCADQGVWCPFHKNSRSTLRIMTNFARAICELTPILAQRVEGVRFVHVDTCEQHRALDASAVTLAEFRNQLRFVVDDLILGRIGPDHPLAGHLAENGITTEERSWFIEHPARIDIRGLDYYTHSEAEWSINGREFPVQNAQGFRALALEYADRYQLPVMLSETNIRGFITDRISWLKFMLQESEQLESTLRQRGQAFVGFCWYPLIDSTDWSSLLREAKCDIDPQGIYWLDERFTRRESELSTLYQALGAGRMTSKQIPGYRFLPPVADQIGSLMTKMADWDWQEPEDRAQLAA